MPKFFLIIIFSLITIVFTQEKTEAKGIKSYLFKKEINKNNTLPPTITPVYEQINLSTINQKAYRSIKKALFLSLIVPGAGQFYVGSYFRGLAFLTIEASLFMGWYHFVVTKQNRAKRSSQKFADQFYSLSKYEDNVLTNLNQSDLVKADLYSNRADLCVALHDPTNRDPKGSFLTCLNFGSNQIYTSTSHYGVIQGERNLKDSSVLHTSNYRLNRFKNVDDFYSVITRQSGHLSLGWIDANDPNKVSPHQIEYLSLFKRTQELADFQNLFFGGLILNHIISAIDASITAYFHNQKLYQKKPLAWYQKIHFYSFLDLNQFNLKTNFTSVIEF